MRAILFAAVAASCLGGPVAAQTPCAPVEDIEAQLAEKYGERMVLELHTADGAIIRIWAAERSWSVVVIGAGGLACLRAAGETVTGGALAPALRALLGGRDA